MDIADSRHPVDRQLRAATKHVDQFRPVGVHESGEGVHGMVQPVGQGFVPGQADEGLLVVVAMGFHQGRKQHHVLHGDRVRGRDFPTGVQYLQPLAPGPQQSGSDFRGVGSRLQKATIAGQDIPVLNASGAIRFGQREHETGPADKGGCSGHDRPQTGGKACSFEVEEG